MSDPTGIERLADRGAAVIVAAFLDYRRGFDDVTRRARTRFEHRDWHGMQRDGAERLELYGRAIAAVEDEVRETLGATLPEHRLWALMRSVYAARIRSWPHRELAETFFNSVTRRIFATVGVDPNIEFISLSLEALAAAVPDRSRPVYRTYLSGAAPLPTLIRDLLRVYSFTVAFESIDRDARLVAAEIDRAWRVEDPGAGAGPIEAIDMLRPVFYRNKGAYLVGRVRGGERTLPLALAVLNGPRGLAVDATLTTADEVSIVFSFTRSYFHVEVERPSAVISFLKSILPWKPTAELYSALGEFKHGKTELYRDLMRHIEQSDDRFEIARGDRGMVMIVFTLPAFDVVFKVIRDTFAYPKTMSRTEVIEKYRLVSRHDRAGRLVDVQEFEHLAFARGRFTDAVLAELAGAAGSVAVGSRIVHFKHLYVERRMDPLNLYLREVGAPLALDAVLDYGQAVKDLAATNIFPGDMLMKNFGVTRHRRVIFYDYDELCLLTECQFRELPPPRDQAEEWSGEPWFYIGPRDIFPEEFLTFLGLPPDLRAAFLARHGDLLTPAYWRALQTRHQAGEIIDILPYPQSRRLHPVGNPTTKT